MKRPTVPPALRHRPFTVAEAARHGLTRKMLESGAWRRVIRGVYVHVDVPDSRELRARAANLLLDPRVFLCGTSAAWIYGIDLHPLGEPVPSLWVGCRNGHRLRTRTGWTLREITVADEELWLVEGVRVTSPVRTGFDCARWLGIQAASMVLDSLLHQRLVTPEGLLAYVAAQRGIRHKRRVPGIVSLAAGRAESPQETRLRLLLVGDGLKPVPQFELFDGDRFIARLDLAFPELCLAVEYEGRQHAETLAADERRRAAIEALGWTVLRVYAEDLATGSARQALLDRVRRELRRRRHETLEGQGVRAR